MALVVKDRVKEVTSTTGTGTLTLAGAVAKFQSFSVVGDGNTTYYAIESGNGSDWEVGVGTYTASGTTLSRDTILESSNGGAAISLSGTSTVFCTYPAERSVNTEDIGVTVQAYDADTAKYDDTTANFTGTLQNGGSNVVVDTDIGSTVQAYDADTTKNDVANTFTANQSFSANVGIGTTSFTTGKFVVNPGGAGSPPVSISQTADNPYLEIQRWTGSASNYYGHRIQAVTSSMVFSIASSAAIGSQTFTEHMRITSSGNVGIGTSSPTEKLNVNGSIICSATSSQIRVGNGVGRLYADAGAVFASSTTSVPFVFQTNSTERIRITPTGNVGIGTSSPDNILHVKTSSAQTTSTFESTSTVQSLVSIRDANTSSGSQVAVGAVADNIILRAGNNERMRITSAGNVGIGTSNPSALLQTYNNQSSGTTAAVQRWSWNNDTTSATWGLKLDQIHTGSAINYSFRIRNNSTTDIDALYLQSNGNVGIGTSSPNSILHVEGTTTGAGTEPDAIAYFKQNGTWGANQPWALYVEGYTYLNGFRINAADTIRSLYKQTAGGQLGFAVAGDDPITFTQSDNTERMRIAAGGNVGIGTSSPNNKLEIRDNSTADLLRLNTGHGLSAYTGIDMYSLNGIYSVAKILFNHGNSYINPVFKIQVANASKVLQDRLLIDTSGNLRFNSGYGSVATAYGCRAWVNFNGIGTVSIRGSGGVSSITDTGTGRYQVNFATAMPDTNYSVSTCGVTNGSNDRFANCLIINTQYTTTYCGLLRWNSSTYDDEDRIQFQAFR